MAATEEMVDVALRVKPDSICMVPEKREELTTEGGLDIKNNKEKLSPIVSKFKEAKIMTSMFIDADLEQLVACYKIGADAVELHTGRYSIQFKKNGAESQECQDELKKIIEVSKEAYERKLILNAGHGLNYENIGQICKIYGMNEFNIGFSIIARAIFCGLEKAVSDMKNLIEQNSKVYENSREYCLCAE
jgi:pyridoxine 5-phosphate synthase